MESCFFNHVCQRNPCEKNSCIRFIEFNSLIQSSNLPKAYIPYKGLTPPDEDYEAFTVLAEIQDNIEKFVSEGQQLYLWSKETGNAKTTWATKLLKSYFGKIWVGNRLRTRGYFCHVPTFLERLKDNISDKNDINVIKETLKNVDLVVWDDIAVKTISEFELGVLLYIIDFRVSNAKANIYTSNLNKQKLEGLLGGRLTSRIYNASKVVQFVSKDKRGQAW